MIAQPGAARATARLVLGSCLLASFHRRPHHGRVMNEVTQLLSALGQGDPHAAGRLLPLVYEG
jgi:hypothetical protein